MNRSSSSLTARLAGWFAVIVVASLASLGWYLDRTLRAELAADENHSLIGKGELVRHLLEEHTLDALRGDPHRFRDVVLGHETLRLALHAADGELLFASTGTAPLRPERDAAVVAQAHATSGDIDTLSQDGTAWRVLSVWGRLGDAARTPVRITLALDTSTRAQVAARYRGRMLLGVVLAALAAAGLGFVVSRTGLQPLRVLARRTGRISASRLDERLPLDNVPVELRELSASFNVTLERLQDSFHRLSQFSSDLAHDLRTPIGNLLGEAQVALSRGRSDAEYRAVIESHVEELERIARMIDNMLFLARADNAQAALARVPLRAREELERIAEYFEGPASDAQLRVRVEGDAPLFADPMLLRRAVANLVSNALAHATPGSEIVLRARADRDGASIDVENPGPGIPAAALAHVFDRFYRVDSARSESAKGSGLGLAIVRSIVKLHGGDAFVTSAPEGPTVFTLRFPAAAAKP